MHPLLHLIATQPQLLADHAEAYAELVAAETGKVTGIWARRAVLKAAALGCLCVAAVLCGVAVMLWAVTPPASLHSPWVLFVSPLLPAVIGLGCLLAARPEATEKAFDNVRRQLKADMAMLREAAN